MADPENIDFSPLQDSRAPLELYRSKLQMLPKVNPGYTAKTPKDGGVAIMLLESFVDGFTHGRIDAEARQGILIPGVAVRRSAVRSVLRSQGTDIDGKSSAEVDLLLTRASDDHINDDVPIPQWTRFLSASGSIPFVSVNENDEIPAGFTTATVRAVQGEKDTYVVGTSDGTANQVRNIPVADILDSATQRYGWVEVGPVGTAEKWTLVDDYFANSGPTDQHAMLIAVNDDYSQLLFGDGEFGAIPTDGRQVRLEHIAGTLGASGRVGPNQVTTLSDTIEVNGESVSITVTNPVESEGGNDEQTVEDAIRRKPYWWRSQLRGVTDEDYRQQALEVAGVLDARASRRGLSTVQIAIIADSESGSPSGGLLQQVAAHIDTIRMEADDILVVGASMVSVDWTLTVRLKRGSRSTVVTPKIETALDNFFSLQTRKAAGQELFGKPDENEGHLWRSDFVEVLEAIDGIANLDVNLLSRVPEVVYDRWSGAASVSEITVGPLAVAETWTIMFLSPTQFRVYGSVSGPQGVGTTDEAFADDINRLSFLVNAGAGMFDRDEAYFKVSPLADNVKLEANEVFRRGTGSLTVLEA